MTDLTQVTTAPDAIPGATKYLPRVTTVGRSVVLERFAGLERSPEHVHLRARANRTRDQRPFDDGGR